MNRMGTNWDLPSKRRFPASSFEYRLFLYSRSFRFAHPPLAYMRARAGIRATPVGDKRTCKYRHVRRYATHVRIIQTPAHWWT